MESVCVHWLSSWKRWSFEFSYLIHTHEETCLNLFVLSTVCGAWYQDLYHAPCDLPSRCEKFVKLMPAICSAICARLWPFQNESSSWCAAGTAYYKGGWINKKDLRQWTNHDISTICLRCVWTRFPELGLELQRSSLEGKSSQPAVKQNLQC